MRGDRIGIIGPNGAGKTTLLKLLLGELAPQRGDAALGTGSRSPTSTSSARSSIDKTDALDNVAEGRDFIELNGSRKHVHRLPAGLPVLARARARADHARSPAASATACCWRKLFAQPANLLVLDEPTNDLDVETLELLEELLVDYQGTLLLVSTTAPSSTTWSSSTLVLEGDGRIGEYVGGYSDWLRQRPAAAQAVAAAAAKPGLVRQDPAPAATPAKRKLSFKEQRELEQLPLRIEQLETDIATRSEAMNDPSFFQQDSATIVKANEALAAVQAELDGAYARWSELDG